MKLSYYERNREHVLKIVKARQQWLGDAYRTANKLQMRQNRRRRRDRGQELLPLR